MSRRRERREAERKGQRLQSAYTVPQSRPVWRSPIVVLTGAAALVGVVVVLLLVAGVIGKSPVVSAQITTPGYLTPTDLASGRSLGNANAPAQMVVWSDFQCPVCQDFAVQVEPRLVPDFVATGKLRITYKDLIVIDTHVQGGHESRDAAAAAECAASQNKFWPFHDYLFANQLGENVGSFTRDRLIALARAAGLDVTTFTSCYDSGKMYSLVDASNAAGAKAGYNSTPTVVLNGKIITSTVWADYTALSAAINAAAAGQSSASPSASSGASAGPSVSATP